jgi:hypothetical protein
MSFTPACSSNRTERYFIGQRTRPGDSQQTIVPESPHFLSPFSRVKFNFESECPKGSPSIGLYHLDSFNIGSASFSLAELGVRGMLFFGLIRGYPVFSLWHSKLIRIFVLLDLVLVSLCSINFLLSIFPRHMAATSSVSDFLWPDILYLTGEKTDR